MRITSLALGLSITLERMVQRQQTRPLLPTLGSCDSRCCRVCPLLRSGPDHQELYNMVCYDREVPASVADVLLVLQEQHCNEEF